MERRWTRGGEVERREKEGRRRENKWGESRINGFLENGSRMSLFQYSSFDYIGRRIYAFVFWA